MSTNATGIVTRQHWANGLPVVKVTIRVRTISHLHVGRLVNASRTMSGK